MKVINVKKDNLIKIDQNVCVIMGNFDGIHQGHQRLINEAKGNFKKVAVLTFDPHPRKVINNSDFRLLTPLDKKIEILKEQNVDYLLLFEFNDIFKEITKEKFIDILRDMNVKNIVCGYDYAFGNKASGTINDLKINFDVNVVGEFNIDNIRVSSTLIKRTLMEGNISLTNKYLGRHYSIKSRVIKGNNKGSKIGFPTANIITMDFVIPKTGVYATTVKIKDKIYKSMTNIGHNPTMNYSEKIKIETHIFDLDELLYGKEVEVYFHEYIRQEMTFDSIDRLKEQLKKDTDTVTEYFKRTADFTKKQL